MRAFVITLEGHPYSERVSERCIRTADEIGYVTVKKHRAVPRGEAIATMKRYGLHWTWCSGTSCPSGLKHHAYPGPMAPRIGCSLSHYQLWQTCCWLDESILILEHDAVFVERFREVRFTGACQINDPNGATPRGAWWSKQMQLRGPGVWPTMQVREDRRVPDGLAGNSAYMIQPWTAAHLIDLCKEIGLWPNDAIMCEQLVEGLEELYPFVTVVKQEESTTSS